MRNFLALTLLSALLGLTNAQSLCPPLFIEFFADPAVPMPTCIHFAMDAKRDWHAAKDYCKANSGSSLAMLDAGNLHYEIIDYILGNPAWMDEGFHIGCTDEIHEGTWLWTDGTPVSTGLPHWYPGQPDGYTKENYCCLYYTDFMYNSCKNGQMLYTICMI
ncbi:hepatic lectin-like [Palaemon carinicauda]|uniref:hepatic lectin-like n=1 Tax=Palaemon carinicauda TaxID=392227 RepID=UPI0035B5E344